MQTLPQQLEHIASTSRKKQIRINGRQLMITPMEAHRILRVLDELSESNRAWFLQQEALALLALANRLSLMIVQREAMQAMRSAIFATTI
jgi:hypothetical protein